jgi:hypothetical protein
MITSLRLPFISLPESLLLMSFDELLKEEEPLMQCITAGCVS